MIVSSYTLKQLLDLALCVPEIGAVNFNILHTVLKTIIEVQGLETTRPYFHLDSPLVAQIASCQEKLKELQAKRSLSEDAQQTVGNYQILGYQTDASATAEDIDKDRQSSVSEQEPADDDQVEGAAPLYGKFWNKLNIVKRLSALEEGLNHLCCEADKQGDKISEVDSRMLATTHQNNIDIENSNIRMKQLLAEQYGNIKLQLGQMKQEMEQWLLEKECEKKEKEREQQEKDAATEENVTMETEINMLKEKTEQLMYQMAEMNDEIKEIQQGKSFEKDFFVLEKRVQELENELDSLLTRGSESMQGMMHFPMSQPGMDMPPPPTMFYKIPQETDEEVPDFSWLDSNLDEPEKKRERPERRERPKKGVETDTPVLPKDLFTKKKEKHHHHHRHRLKLGETLPPAEEEEPMDDLSLDAVKNILLKKVKPVEQLVAVEEKKAKKTRKVTAKNAVKDEDRQQEVAVGKVTLEPKKKRVSKTVTLEAVSSSVDVEVREDDDEQDRMPRKKKKKKEKVAAESPVGEEQDKVVDETMDSKELVKPETQVDEPKPEQEPTQEISTPLMEHVDQVPIFETHEMTETRRLTLDAATIGKDIPAVLGLDISPATSERVAAVDLGKKEEKVDAKDVDRTARRASVKEIETSVVSTKKRATSIIELYPDPDEKGVKEISMPDVAATAKITTGEELAIKSPSVSEEHVMEKDVPMQISQIDVSQELTKEDEEKVLVTADEGKEQVADKKKDVPASKEEEIVISEREELAVTKEKEFPAEEQLMTAKSQEEVPVKEEKIPLLTEEKEISTAEQEKKIAAKKEQVIAVSEAERETPTEKIEKIAYVAEIPDVVTGPTTDEQVAQEGSVTEEEEEDEEKESSISSEMGSVVSSEAQEQTAESEKSSGGSSKSSQESESESSKSGSASSSGSSIEGEGKTKDVQHTLGVLQEIEKMKRMQTDAEAIKTIIGRTKGTKPKKLHDTVMADESDEEGLYDHSRDRKKSYMTADDMDEQIKALVLSFDSNMRNKLWEFDDKIRNVEDTLVQTMQKMANDFENQIQLVNEKVMNRDKNLNRRTDEIESLTRAIQMLRNLKADKHFVYQEICRKAEITDVCRKVDSTTLLSVCDSVMKNVDWMQEQLKVQEAKLENSLKDIESVLAQKLFHEDYMTLQETVDNRIKNLQHSLKKLQMQSIMAEARHRDPDINHQPRTDGRSERGNISTKVPEDTGLRFPDGFKPAIVPNNAVLKTKHLMWKHQGTTLDSVAVRGTTRYAGGAHTMINKSQVVKLPSIK